MGGGEGLRDRRRKKKNPGACKQRHLFMHLIIGNRLPFTAEVEAVLLHSPGLPLGSVCVCIIYIM